MTGIYTRRRLISVVVTVVIATTLTAAQQTPLPAVQNAPLSQVVPIDPQITVGTLANGVRYYIRANTQPRNRAAYGQTDASLRYNLTPTLAIYADAINLSNQRTHEYALNQSQFLTLEDVGRRVSVGVRAAF